ncbi:glycoside hydrolase [Candidatus Saccharibacteria bacterium]|nr:glycoside hydrolase [Candidatus Saccharibacteria bacterium]HOR23420.1 trehalase family glycosidase [Candidatus Saccharibacteria bacterium]
MENQTLSEVCYQILKANDRGTHTVPATNLYPHQWLWDSCFASIGWSHIDTKRAEKEILSLLRGQWSNGMIPHMIFDMSPEYSRHRNMWRSWISSKSPDKIATSGLTQPPVIAEAVSRIGAQMNRDDRLAFYKRVLPRLVKHHEWLYNERDPHKTGLVIQIHPHETGMDNTPPWIEQLREHSWPWWVTLIEKLHLEGLINSIRQDVQRIPKEQRARNIDGMVCWEVIRRLRRKHYDIEKILHRSLFIIEDVSFISIFIRNNTILREIAAEARVKLPKELLQNMQNTEDSIEKLWDETYGIYFSRDFITDHLLKLPTISSLMPLYAGTISKKRAEKLVQVMTNDQTFWTKFPVPTAPKNARYFEPNRYWQGPTWVNTNWMLIDGLRRYGFNNEAAALKSNTLEMIRKNGVWEYYNPSSGKGLGIQYFSWTAALALDLLEE